MGIIRSRYVVPSKQHKAHAPSHSPPSLPPLAQATREAIEEASTHLEDVDEAFVFVLSDANLERYGIRPSDFAEALTSHPKVNAHACFLASLGGAAERLTEALPAGKASVCLDASELPKAFRRLLVGSALREEEE